MKKSISTLLTIAMFMSSTALMQPARAQAPAGALTANTEMQVKLFEKRAKLEQLQEQLVKERGSARSSALVQAVIWGLEACLGVITFNGYIKGSRPIKQLATLIGIAVAHFAYMQTNPTRKQSDTEVQIEKEIRALQSEINASGSI